MANFCYKAISAKGKTVRGVVEADTERQAIASVREKGLVPLSVESASASVANPGMPSSKSSFKKILESLHPVPKTAVAAMGRQLATLLHAGLPLDEALASICAHDDVSRMQGIVSRLRDRIMAGGDLADGLAEFPNVFSSTFVTMVRAGEASGTLELVIERFAEHIEQQVALVRKVQATLAYPILMLFVGIGVVIFLLTFVIPKVTQIFSDMGRALPVPTQILLAVSDGIRSGWWIILLLVLCIMIGVWRMRRTEGVLYLYRQHAGSVTKRALDANAEIMDAIDDVLTWYQARGLFEQYENELGKLCVDNVLYDASVRILKAQSAHPLLPQLLDFTAARFPDYRHNPYLKGYPARKKLVLSLLGKKQYRAVHMLFAAAGH